MLRYERTYGDAVQPKVFITGPKVGICVKNTCKLQLVPHFPPILMSGADRLDVEMFANFQYALFRVSKSASSIGRRGC